MGSQLIQLIMLAGVALFLILRLRSVLGSRDGFEKPAERSAPESASSKKKFDVIDGGGIDQDIADFVDVDGASGKALAEMKKADPSFSVHEFINGARQAYEMILMAFENGDVDFLRDFLAPDVLDTFATAIAAREDLGLTVQAEFIGVRELKLREARYNAEEAEAEIVISYVGELTSVVRDSDGKIVEGNPNEIKKQSDIWTFARLMTSGNPNWLLVGTGD
ncbi:MAG TPA: Tim44/TimA family putative adaptor protein [Paracoccaceae bacterium]|nr:Tim44/TimA family putative adaptor protein [Paracoccaceae bacterium]